MLIRVRAFVCIVGGTMLLGAGGFGLWAHQYGAGFTIGLVGAAGLWYGRRLKRRGDLGEEAGTAVVRQRKFARRLWRRHWQTGAVLVAINVAVYYVCNMDQGRNLLAVNSDDLVRWGGNFPPFAAHGQAWRFLTSMFLHADAKHLLGNMIALLLVSRYVDYLLGRTQMLLVYVATGVIGGLAQTILDPAMTCVGASGAIMGLEGVLLSAIVFGRPDGKRLALSKVAMGILAYHGVNNVVEGFGHEGVANAAHVGGFLSGFAVYAALWRFKWSEDKFVPALIAATFAIFVLCQVSVFRAIPSANDGRALLALRSNARDLGAALGRVQSGAHRSGSGDRSRSRRQGGGS